MDLVLSHLTPPPYNENSEKESQLAKTDKADRYKMMRILAHGLVFSIFIIFILAITAGALTFNPLFQPKWIGQTRG